MAAWLSVATPETAQVTNTVNNSPTVNVNAQVSQNVDVNYLGNQLAKQLLLSNKWIN
jgi:hypothetical protein